jgi:uncharacterized damage-inducible protein DinB
VAFARSPECFPVDGREEANRARALAKRLREAAGTLIDVVDQVEEDRWSLVPGTGVWSIGKDAEHVADAASYHQWIVRHTIGEAASSQRPLIERTRMTTAHSPRQVIEMVRARTEEGVRLLLSLTDAQLDLPTRPPRARGQGLEETIERVLIGHYNAHRADIEAKLR